MMPGHSGGRARWYCDPDDRDPLGCLKVKLPSTAACKRCCGWTADRTKWPVARRDPSEPGEALRQMLGIDGTAGDAQDVPHPFIPASPGGACAVCGLSRTYDRHVENWERITTFDDVRTGDT